MGIPMLKIRRSWDCLIFNMGIPILVRRHLYIETAPRWSFNHLISTMRFPKLMKWCFYIELGQWWRWSSIITGVKKDFNFYAISVWRCAWKIKNSDQNWEKNLQVCRTSYFQMFTGPLFQMKLHLLSTVLLSVFQSSMGALKSTNQGSTW